MEKKLPSLLVCFFLVPAALWGQEMDVSEKITRLMNQQQLQNTQLLQVLEEQDRKISAQQRQIGELKQLLEEQTTAQKTFLEEQSVLHKQLLDKLSTQPAPITIKAPSRREAAGLATDVKVRIRNLEKLVVVSFLVAGLNSIFLLLALYLLRRPVTTVEKSIQKKEITGSLSGSHAHKREMKPLTFGRPQLEVQTRQGRLALINTGKMTADHIKLYMGTTPSNLERRQKMVTTIQAAGRVEIDLSSYPIHEFLYGSLEYKNPSNGKLYKDQFILKNNNNGELQVANSLPRIEELSEIA